MLARCRGSFFLFFLPSLLLATGCRNRTDLLENELRTKDAMYRDAMRDQQSTQAQLETMHQEIEALRKGAHISPELAAQTFGLKRIALGRATGGYDLDGLPGDELLQVVVEPRDQDDHTIKAPGTLQIFALEITPQGIKLPLCSWEIPPERLRQSWKEGLLSTGYTLTLPWKNFPQFESVRVIARLVLSDQRVFETDKDVKVRVVPGASLKRCDPIPDGLPAPRPLLPSEAGPSLLPTGQLDKSTNWMAAKPANSSLPVQETQWQPTSMRKSVSIGRPQPLDAPAAPPPLSSVEEMLKPH